MIKTFGKKEAIFVFHEAAHSSRKRKNYNFHEFTDTVQRFVNAMMPFSYVRPHRHFSPPRTETFVLLSGKIWVIIFDDMGHVIEAVLMDGKNVFAIDLASGCWHTIIPIAKSLTFEVKPGPYNPVTDKEFALWAPSEEDTCLHAHLLAHWIKEATKLAHYRNHR